MPRRLVVMAVAGLALAGGAWPVRAQLPFTGAHATGQTVTPAFEGWYRHADGSVSLSFGYFNRNTAEAIDVPVGPNNFIAPGPQNQNQPTHFQPRRHWGVFAVRLPAGSPVKEVTWTLTVRGTSYAIPGTLHPNWQIDALEGEAGSNNTPPVLKLGATGAEARGPQGAIAGPISATAGAPLAISVFATDDGRSASSLAGRGAGPTVSLAFFKHQGPGAVSFAPPTARVPAAGAEAKTSVTFTDPGEYVLRVRANDASGVAGAGHAQCCWTNGFIKVTVTR
jgi:hypothetical protein